MVQETYTESIRKIIDNQEKIEQALDVKINNKGKLLFIEGNPENEYLAVKVIEAIELGFSPQVALSLKDEDNMLQVLNIKDITKRHDLERVRARIIGTHGKTKENMEMLSECRISVHDNQVGIIGSAECIKEAVISLESLIRGSKQGNVYARLEKKKKERRLNPSVLKKSDLKFD